MYKKGAASFYIVAFSTLILVVLATSFALIITSEIARTSNDDLSQSAYDSALAGTEDAKVAFSNYRRCAEAGVTPGNTISGGSKITCADIMYWMHHPDCYMVGHILGKIPKDVEAGKDQAEVVVGGEVVASGSTETTTNQAYTCVMIDTDLADYRATLNRETKIRTFRISVGDKDTSTNNINKIKISWYNTAKSNVGFKYNSFANSGNRVVFPKYSISNVITPPMVELQIVQTAPSFTMSQFDEAVSNGSSSKTNRATLYLVPTNNMVNARKGSSDNNRNYIGIYRNNNKNVIYENEVAKTNDRKVSNKAFLTYCDPDPFAEFYCSVEIELPEPIGSDVRNNNTFMISVALPYQQPDTDFAVEAYCPGNSAACGELIDINDGADSGSKQAKIANTQISIDSTGRANDLYRRVETRLETADTTFGAGYPYYALQVLGDDGINKNMRVEYEKECVGTCFYF